MLNIARGMGIPVVVGGPDASACHELYMNWGADYAVIGEGEETSAELLRCITGDPNLAIEDICGLAYKKNGEIVVNARRPLVKDLDQLPFPDWKAIDVGRYLSLWRDKNGYTSLHILSSRGCPFSCSWCSRAVFGRTVRQRSVENVLKEISELWNLYHPDSIWFADDTFTLNNAWIEKFSDSVVQSGNIVPFRCFTRADRVTPQVLKKLKSAGCRLIHMGVESGSQRVLDAMNKGQKIEAIQNASQQIHNAGIELNYFIMFGYPGENLQDIRATESLIQKANPDSVGFSIAYPVPGTEFYNLVKDKLDDDIDSLWEKTTEGIQRMFQTAFSLNYYRKTIQHIQLRMQLKNSSCKFYEKIDVWLNYIWLGLNRWLMEHL